MTSGFVVTLYIVNHYKLESDLWIIHVTASLHP